MTGFITPPTEQEEQYPYRRVWLSIGIEMSVFAALVALIFVVTRFVSVPGEFNQLIGLVTALVPATLWLIFSWLRERRAEQPRQHLIMVVIVTALVANAVALPFIDTVFRVDQWLPLESAITRIVGYTFTIGVVQALVVYLVLRYSVWPEGFRIRLDGVAFGASSAVGYATVVNLRDNLMAAAPPLISAMNSFNQQSIMLCTGIIVGYGLAELWFNSQPFPLIAAFALALAALVTGIAVPLIAGFGSASISVDQPQGASSPIQGFLFAAALLIAVALVFNFLFNVAERESADTALDETESLRT